MKNPIGPLWAQFAGFLSDLAEDLGDWRQRRKTARQERAAAKEAADKTKRDAKAEAQIKEADAKAKSLRQKAEQRAAKEAEKAEQASKASEAARERAADKAKGQREYKDAEARRKQENARLKEVARQTAHEQKLRTTAARPAVPQPAFTIIGTSLKFLGILLVPIALAAGIGWNYGIAGQLSLIVLIWYIIFGLIIWGLAPKFFTDIPLNHIVCVVIKDALVHFMCNKADKEKLISWVSALPPEHKIRLNFNANQIVTREDHWFWGILVHLFNLHFKSWRPSTLKQVKVIRTMIGTRKEGAPLSSWIIYKDQEKEVLTPFLRLEFPRHVFINDAELAQQVKMDLVISVTGISMLDPYGVFFVHTDISAWIDSMLHGAVTNYVSKMTRLEFDSHPFTADPESRFNQFMCDKNTNGESNAGFTTAGFIVTGSAAIVDKGLDASEEALKKATTDQRIAAEELETARLRAEANAATIVKEGEAKAEAAAELIEKEGEAKAKALRAKGLAEAENAERLASVLATNPSLATIKANEALAGGSITTVINGGVIPTFPIQPTPTPPPSNP